MSFRTRRAAEDDLRGQIQRAISCVKAGMYLQTVPGYGTDVRGLAVNNGKSFTLRAATPLALNVGMQYRTVELAPRSFRLHTVAYSYALEDANTTRELFAYHWHPETRDSVSFPHLHIASASGQLRPEYARAHFNTGRVTLEEVLQLIVRDFGVQPVRSDWETVLGQV